MHPLVYLDLQRDGRVTCPYCGAIFVHRGTADDTET
ncbi:MULTISPECIES: zinc-finger domain-containing protein [Neorickettsia]|nr:MULTISPECIES: zinc-finger domain-containing protein [Neorickettsia]